MRVLSAALAALLVACAGSGEGEIRGQLVAPECRLDGGYDLHPTFFGADRSGVALAIRIQNGGSAPDFTDNLVITVDDTDEVAAQLARSTARDAEGRPVVTLPVAPRGVPGVLVHATLSPNWSCGRRRVTALGQNVGLWAYEGTITFRAIDQGDRPQPAGAPERARLTDVSELRLRLHDPRPIGPVAPEGVPPDAAVGSAELSGWFRFEFSRSRPAQFFYP
jgi:hypothetical protein